VGRPVKLGDRHDIAAGVGQIDDGEMQCRLAGADRKRTDPPSSSAIRASSTAVVGLAIRL